MEQQKDIKTIISHYGNDLQKQVAIEEMAELTKEICKTFRGAPNMSNIIEEIVDVQLMLMQLIVMFGLDESYINYYVKGKIERTLAQIDKESKINAASEKKHEQLTLFKMR